LKLPLQSAQNPTCVGFTSFHEDLLTNENLRRQGSTGM
jgi:hypothetical protein